MVWLAAELVTQSGLRFDRYALLGDDIVIADEKVAVKYQELLQSIGVDISIEKTLFSNNGSLEFAKRFYTKGLSVDLSPVSAKAVLTIRSTVGLCQLAERYKITRISTLFRLAGAGYRTRARLQSKTLKSKRWLRLIAVASKPPINDQYSFEWWLGGGKPLNPYVKGIIVDLMRKALKPKEITLVPSELTFEGQRDNFEYTLYRSWLSSWLLWLKWYCVVALSPDPKIEDLLKAPMVETSWCRRTFDADIYKYGGLWRCYDLVFQKWTLNMCPPCIEGHVFHPNGWISGGLKGEDFI